MLFLTFQIGKDRYALDSAQVVEVLPLVRHKQIPHAAAGVIGAFVYHGKPVPLIDLAQLCLGVPARIRMSTRIFLINYTREPEHLLGLVAEHATQTIRREAHDFTNPGVAVDAAPYLGPVTTDAHGMIQRIEVHQLLPAEVRNQLFRQPMGFS